MEKLSYDQFLTWLRQNWKQGEHFSIVAPTGQGKTIVARDIISIRKYLVIIATKRTDESLDRYKGIKRIKSWPPNYDQRRVMLWIKPTQEEVQDGDFNRQISGISLAIGMIYIQTSWAIYFDDMFYIANTLGMKRVIQMLYTQARSQYITLIASIQRPRNVPVEVFNQSTYLLVGKTRDKLDVERIAEEMGYDPKELLRALSELDDYEFLLLQHGKAIRHIGRANL